MAACAAAGPHLRHDDEDEDELSDDGHARAYTVGGPNAPAAPRTPLPR
ncbi:hypothetical protein [Krasilnikovia sp. M28-CT-15]